MSQLKQSCTVTNSSQAVVMPGVNVAAQIRKNFIFMVEGELVPYFIAADAVFDGTNTTFSLTGLYVGGTRVQAPGIVVVDNTYPDAIPTISQGDVGTAQIFTAAMYRIQSLITSGTGAIGGGTSTGGTGATNTDQLPEGVSNLYFNQGRVRSTLLAGFAAGLAQVVSAGDTILTALQKLQAQLTAHVGNGGLAHAVATPTLAGFMSAADKAKLDAMGGANAGLLTVGDTPPANPVNGQEWLNTATGRRLVWLTDANSSQWVEL